MSTWASRLSSSKSVSPTSGTANRGAATLRDFSSVSDTASPTSMVSGGGAGADVGAGSRNAAALLREEFRAVAEVYNEQNVCLLHLPPDCWDMTAKYLSYMDVIALGQACRFLWKVLHKLDSLWRRQLSYFYNDMRDLRGGKLLCTAPLFPEPPCSRSTSHQGSMGALTGSARGQEWPRKAWHQPYMSAYERFFQERRVYVLDSHREWHFQELADVEDKSTGMFTVALHDGRVEAVTAAASPLSADPFSFSGAWSASPIFANAVDSTREWLLAAPSSPASFAASQPPASPAQTPTPLHARTTSTQTNGTSIGSSPALAPAAAPSTPPLLPRVGEPIINERNPLLRLRVYTIEPVETEENRDDEAAEVAADASRIDEERHRSHVSLASSISASLSGMTEEQVIEYVMRLSLAEAQQTTSRSSPSAPATEAPSNAKPAATDPVGSATQQQPKLYRHRHYRGANPAASLPLSELLAILDAFTNNASDQLQYHHVRNCTEDEDPAFLQRLSETLRSAKHRRLHLGNHHRAVRNNGQTTRNRAGRSAGAGSADAPSLSLSAAGTATPPQQPPPMNRMLRGFHGDLLEITEREAQLVAGTLLGMPRAIDEFVAFRCYDPALLYHRLHPSSTAIDRVDTRGTPREARGEAPWLKDNSVLSDSVSHISRQTTQVGSSEPTYQSVETPAAIPPLTTRTPPLRPLPFFTRFFLAPELCHDGYIALIVVDVVRALVIVEKEVVTTDNPDWASPLIARGGRVVVHGQGYNAQAYTRDEYNYVPLNPTRRRRNSDSGE
ncbi:conserved hypothetical protein [Leishmania major strain Friedlin]|uniref:F-box domain-containing protein n=1 Tax=Leishmania major TaxID=5664 RepID=Q4Q468_LEIMA|nr:conserved hypothetical protein [Leishmania major strain Friedlin]CAG9580697.1 hypothetical_protein_-_conserved [Leishmania major strain Friedlin]CAJ06270.1 conserved hypothetical protein [Leishmania major strain Friedlin]|eukprot:XP_001685880.1 conserved hypothetical protein [Leishmania major strain Friedlin]